MNDIICYTSRIPCVFAEQLVHTLKQCHQRVISTKFSRLDTLEIDVAKFLSPYFGKHVKAIIGVHCTLFCFRFESHYIHDLVTAPKYNFIFDHPAGVRDLIISSPKSYYPLLLDRNYVSFVRQYYRNYIDECYHLPPTGINIEKFVPMDSRIYDISFIGEYSDYRNNLRQLFTRPYTFRHLIARFLYYMKRNPSIPAEKAFKKALVYYDIELNDMDFEKFFAHFHIFSLAFSNYCREKVIETLLKSGITIHLFDNSWSNAPFLNCQIASYIQAALFMIV